VTNYEQKRREAQVASFVELYSNDGLRYTQLDVSSIKAGSTYLLKVPYENQGIHTISSPKESASS
jgi:hypothetical protein